MKQALPIIHGPDHGKGSADTVVNRWIYVLPIAPAAIPSDLYHPDGVAGVLPDPLAPSFKNGWGNVAGKEAVRFEKSLRSHVRLHGALQGGSLPSVAFTLPLRFRPPKDEPIIFPSTDGVSVFTGIVHVNGDVEIIGEPVDSGGGGSSVTNYTPPTGLDIYFAVTSVPTSAFTNLAWTLDSGPGLLNLSNPLMPTVITDGIYAVSLSAFPNATHAGKFWQLELDLDEAGRDPYVLVTGALDAISGASPQLSLANTAYVPMGGIIDAYVNHNVGSSADFTMQVAVQRMT